MSWLQFWKRNAEDSPTVDRPPGNDAGSPDGGETPERTIPPHVRDMLAAARHNPPPPSPEDAAARTFNALKRKRLAALYDIEQGELAQSSDNPWTNRIALLSEALETVTADITVADQVVPGPFHPLPATPVTFESSIAEDVVRLTVTVNGSTFTYEEDADWAERGHQIARAELARRSGDVASLVPGNTPDSLRTDLTVHLDRSLDVFATDLRDRLVDGEPFPHDVTLADLARPCPVCGGWTDWRGTCQACTHRAATLQALRREYTRLLDERAEEAEERHRLVERLSVARRRLRDVDAELAAAEERGATAKR